jgi:hypothetical protein
MRLLMGVAMCLTMALVVVMPMFMRFGPRSPDASEHPKERWR